MSKFSHRLELAANLLIVTVAVLLIGAFVQKFIFNKQAGAKAQPVVGAHVNLIDDAQAGQSRTLILALQTTCHFCNESAPLYKRLIEVVKNKNVKLVAVLPTSTEESKAHLDELGLTNLEVKRSPLDAIQVGGTPTLILTNEKGEVTDFWVGKLPPNKEKEVIDKLSS
jgi:thioredoxin-related protein